MLNFNIAGLTSEELEHLFRERLAAFGTVKRIAICDSLEVVSYKLAFIGMASPAELAAVMKETGAISIGDAAVLRLDLKPAAKRAKFSGVAAIALAAVVGIAVLFGLFRAAEQRSADAAFVYVFSNLELGQSRKEVDAAAASLFGLSFQPPGSKPSMAAYASSCCSLLLPGTRYDLLAGYDANDRLLSARLLKLPAADGDQGCNILFEIPSLADKTYPYACPADARGP